jgi:hypothetical protein
MTEKFDHDNYKAGQKSVAQEAAALAPVIVPDPVFEGRSGRLAVALRARNINVVAAKDIGDTGAKLTIGTPTGDRVYELEGRYADFFVALAVFGGRP